MYASRGLKIVNDHRVAPSAYSIERPISQDAWHEVENLEKFIGLENRSQWGLAVCGSGQTLSAHRIWN